MSNDFCPQNTSVDSAQDLSQSCNNAQFDKTKWSYWKTNSIEPLLCSTIGNILDNTVAKYPNRTAVSFFGGQKYTFQEVLDKVDILAAALIRLGLKRGDHLALWGFNSIEWYISFLAAMRAGIVAVNLNPFYQSLEMLSCLKSGDVKAIIMDEKLNDRNFYDVLKKAVPDIERINVNEHITSDAVPLLKTVIIISEEPYKGTFRWKDLFDLTDVTLIEKIKTEQFEISAQDICNIQFTSGTTGRPKGVQLTHYSMINPPHFVGKYLNQYNQHHRICLQVPLFHVYGTITGILGSILTANTLIFPSRKFSPNKSIDCIIQEKCTLLHGTATMYTDLLTISQRRVQDDPFFYDKLSTIELIHTGGALCLPEMIQQLRQCFKNAKFMHGYGMTETSTTTIMSMPEDSMEVILSTLGRVIDHVEVKVIDHQDNIVPLGTPGEMCFKGHMIMKGYYKESDKTREILTPDGWLRSGDRFILLENGYAQIVGRIKDLIIRGGENIQPKEVETFLSKHPDVIDVQVYGITDTRLGEAVAAAIIKNQNSALNEQQIQKYCHGMIASFKIPQHVIFVQEFPITASGKVQKFKLREMTEQILRNQ